MDTYLLPHTRNSLRQISRPQPEPPIEPALSLSDRQRIRPRLAFENGSNSHVIDPSQRCHLSQGHIAGSFCQIQNVNANDLHSGIIGGHVRPGAGELFRFESWFSSHPAKFSWISDIWLNLYHCPHYAVSNYLQQLLDSTLKTDEQQAITVYTPARIPPQQWVNIREMTIEAVTRYRAHHSNYKIRDLMNTASSLIYWATEIACLPSDLPAIFHRDVIATFIEHQCNHLTNNTKVTRRSLLIRMSEAILPHPQRVVRLKPLSKDQPSAPYNSAEVMDLRDWAIHQNHQRTRINLAGILALCLGAGLSTSDLLDLRAQDIENDEYGYIVHIKREGARRDVPLLYQWEPLLSQVLEHRAPSDWVVGPGRDGHNKNWVSNYLKKHYQSWRKTYPSVARMRHTWIFHHMVSGTPLGPMAYAAGLETFRTIEKLFPFVPEPSRDSVRHALRQAPYSPFTVPTP